MGWDKSHNTIAVEDLRTTTEEENMMEGEKKPFVPIVLCSQQRFVLLFKKKTN